MLAPLIAQILISLFIFSGFSVAENTPVTTVVDSTQICTSSEALDSNQNGNPEALVSEEDPFDILNNQSFLESMEQFQRLQEEAEERARKEFEARRMKEKANLENRHLAALTPALRELVEGQLQIVPTVLANIRLTETLKALVVKVQGEAQDNAPLQDLLTKFANSIADGSVERLFFSDITKKETRTVAPVLTFGPADLGSLYKALECQDGQATRVLLEIIQALIKTDYKEAAQLCYEQHADAIESLQASLADVRMQLKTELLKEENCEVGALRDALVYWSLQLSKHLNTLISLQKLASRAGTDINWLLYAFSEMYRVVEPYFMLYGQFNLRGLIDPERMAAGRSFFNATKIADLAARGAIGLCAMLQNPCETAGRDLTQLISGDASRVNFIDPLNEGSASMMLAAIVQYGMDNGSAFASAFSKPTLFARQLSASSIFLVRFSCALAYHNLKFYWWEGNALPNPIENKAVDGELNRAVLRLGIFALQGHVTGELQGLIFQEKWRGALFKLEEFTMGIVGPDLVTEFVDVLIRAALMQHSQLVENNLVKFSEFDIHGYQDYWYVERIYKSYMAQALAAGQRTSWEGLDQYRSHNQSLFYQYRILYHVFGSVGRFLARKLTAANIDTVSAYAGKAVRSLAGFLVDDKEQVDLGMPLMSEILRKETIVMMLQPFVQMVMHSPGHPMRNTAIEKLRQLGLLPLGEQDEQVINNQIISGIVQHCLNFGIFDYRNAYECMIEYRKNSHNVGAFIPYLVDKITDGILIAMGGYAGKLVGWRIAERFFTDPELVPPAMPVPPGLPIPVA